MRFWKMSGAALGFVLGAALAAGAPIYNTAVGSSDWIGSRTYSSGGLNAHNVGPGWEFPVGSGISWNITYNNVTGIYNYSYSFFGPNQTALEMSHFILEVSPNCSVVEGQSECVWGFQGKTEFKENWSSGPGNPGMPGGIFGVKFDEERSTYTFSSDRNPVWGNFYAKKGTSGLWNLGLESTYANSGNSLYFIPRPDTDSPTPEIPEPGTWALIGAGLAAVGLLRRRG